MKKQRELHLVLCSLLVLAVGGIFFVLPPATARVAATPAPTTLATLPPGDFPQRPPLSLTLTLAFTCCALGAVVGVIVLGFVIGIQRRKEDKSEKQQD